MALSTQSVKNRPEPVNVRCPLSPNSGLSLIECYGISLAVGPFTIPVAWTSIRLRPDRRMRASDFESEGREFEYLRARHHLSLQIKVSCGFCFRSLASFVLQSVASRCQHFQLVTERCHSLHATRAQHGASGFVLAVHRNLNHRAVCESGISWLSCSENHSSMTASNGSLEPGGALVDRMDEFVEIDPRRLVGGEVDI
jgi:hypothetical protein